MHDSTSMGIFYNYFYFCLLIIILQFYINFISSAGRVISVCINLNELRKRATQNNQNKKNLTTSVNDIKNDTVKNNNSNNNNHMINSNSSVIIGTLLNIDQINSTNSSDNVGTNIEKTEDEFKKYKKEIKALIKICKKEIFAKENELDNKNININCKNETIKDKLEELIYIQKKIEGLGKNLNKEQDESIKKKLLKIRSKITDLSLEFIKSRNIEEIKVDKEIQAFCDETKRLDKANKISFPEVNNTIIRYNTVCSNIKHNQCDEEINKLKNDLKKQEGLNRESRKKEILLEEDQLNLKKNIDSLKTMYENVKLDNKKIIIEKENKEKENTKLKEDQSKYKTTEETLSKELKEAKAKIQEYSISISTFKDNEEKFKANEEKNKIVPEVKTEIKKEIVTVFVDNKKNEKFINWNVFTKNIKDKKNNFIKIIVISASPILIISVSIYSKSKKKRNAKNKIKTLDKDLKQIKLHNKFEEDNQKTEFDIN